jgi:hypothetical protein
MILASRAKTSEIHSFSCKVFELKKISVETVPAENYLINYFYCIAPVNPTAEP